MRRLWINMTLWIVLALPIFANAQSIGQLVTVTTQFRDIAVPAALWVEIRDPHAGSVRPFYMRLDQRAQAQVFSTQSNDYYIQRIWMEFDDGTVIRPCAHHKDLLNQKSVEIILSGMLEHTFDRPRCHVKYPKSMPIQQAIAKKQMVQLVDDGDSVITDEENYYQALLACEPSAYRFKAYQPFLDELVETLVVIEGKQDKRCVVLQENNLSAAGAGVTGSAITRCNFSDATQKKMTPENIGLLLDTSQNGRSAKNSFYTTAMCGECRASVAGKPLRCFEKFASKKNEEKKKQEEAKA